MRSLFVETEIDRRSAIYFGLMSIGLLLGFAQTLIFARILEPEALGLFATAMTVSSLGSLVQIGVLSGLTRELPVMIGAKRFERADSLVRSTTSTLAGIVTFGIPVFVLIVLLYPWGDTELRGAMLLTGIWVMTRMFAELSILRLRSEQALIAFPIVIVTQRVVTIVVGGLAADRIGFEGLIVVIVVTDVVTYALLTAFKLRNTGFGLPQWPEVKYLISIGFPAAAAGSLRAAQLSGEKLFILWQLGAPAVGIYQVAWWPLGAAITLNGVINQYFAPKLLHNFGSHQSVKTVFKESLRVSGLLLAMGFVALIPSFFLVEPLVDRMLPAYSDSVPAMRLFLVASVFTVANFAHIAILAANRPGVILRMQVFTSLATIATYAIVVSLTTSLVWVATVSLAGITFDYIARLLVAKRVVDRHELQVAA